MQLDVYKLSNALIRDSDEKRLPLEDVGTLLRGNRPTDLAFKLQNSSTNSYEESE